VVSARPLAGAPGAGVISCELLARSDTTACCSSTRSPGSSPLVLGNLRQPLEEGVIRVARATVAVSQASLGEHAGRHVHLAQRRSEDLVGLHHDATTCKRRE
jgi:hypothetical protein